MVKRLSNVKKYRVIQGYGHMDFLIATNAKTILYNDILIALEL